MLHITGPAWLRSSFGIARVKEKLLLSVSLAWVVGFILFLASGDFELRVVPEPGHGQAWLKQQASPTGKVVWFALSASGLVIAATILLHGCRYGLRWLQRFTPHQRVGIVALLLVGAGGATAAVVRARQIPATPEHQRIAAACLSLARSAPTLPDDILQPGDPKIPEALRALNPIQVVVTPKDVVVFVSGSLREYHLSQNRSDTNTWILYGAIASSGRHVEVLRLKGN